MPYDLQISDCDEDTVWDEFLAATPGGHHVQTSLWARVKALVGWKPVRVLVWKDGQIVAGAQVLIRRKGLLGAIGYAAKAPVFGEDDVEARVLVLSGLRTAASSHRIHYLAIQPPNHGETIVSLLIKSGFIYTPVAVEPLATLQIDLTNDTDAILAEMGPKTRYNIRLGLRKGITVRQGDEGDLHVYYQMLKATSQRQGFNIFSEEYFANMWRLMHPPGYLQLFLAHSEGAVVAAQLAVPFGDTLINKLSVWSGDQGASRPNEALQWHAIAWGKAHGYHFYDFEGINHEAAKVLVQGQPLPDNLRQTITSFKLGFGGTVLILPGVHTLFLNPLAKGLYRLVPPDLIRSDITKQFLHRFRTG